MERLGIEPISVFGMPPVPYIELAADLGLRYIAIMLTAMPNSYGYPPFSLRDDRELRRQTLAALHDREVSIALGEGMVVREDTDMRDLATDIAVMGELGAHRVNTMSFDPDRNRTIDRFGAVAELAAAAGMETTFEFGPTKPVGRTLPEGVEIIRAVGRQDFRLLIDTMHLVRSGSGAEDVAALDPQLDRARPTRRRAARPHHPGLHGGGVLRAHGSGNGRVASGRHPGGPTLRGRHRARGTASFAGGFGDRTTDASVGASRRLAASSH